MSRPTRPRGLHLARPRSGRAALFDATPATSTLPEVEGGDQIPPANIVATMLLDFER